MSIRIALAGNPNCGKTTLFNALTGSNQFVGNWPGVTVEKKEGKLKKHQDVTVTDLPGIYSLSPYTLEEVVARNYLVNERPDVILNVVDATNLERNLYLTTQLTELGIPVVIALNMMDVVKKSGDKINVSELSRRLGCEIVEISALKGDGIELAASTAVKAANYTITIPQHSFSGAVEHAVAHIEEAALHSLPESEKRWYAIKIFERDEKAIEALKLDKSILSHIEADIKAAEEELDDDSESIITNERYVYIAELMRSCCKKKSSSKLSSSDRIDRIVTNRWLGLPTFAVVMFLVYYISMVTIGTAATDWTNDGLFGDGWHLFGIGASEYEEAAEEYGDTDAIISAFITEFQGEEALDAIDASSDSFNNESARTAITMLLSAVPESAEVTYITTDDETLEDTECSASRADLESAAEQYLNLEYKENLGAPETESYGIWVPSIPAVIESGLDAISCADWLKGLILDGIVAGVGAVLGFVPQMLVLFLLLAFLEACGYMARIAFVLDRVFRKFGLSGKSFIPILIGTGCGIPGIMASRTIENERDRRMTIMTTTFIPCGAKMPFIAMIAGAIFGGSAIISTGAYFIGIAAIIVSGIMLKKTKMFAGNPAPFVMELPAYHMPTLKNVLRSMWERGWSFIKKAGTIILLSTIAVWFTSYFGFVEGRFTMLDESQMHLSLLAYIGNALCWIFAPLGWGNWQAAVATITGLVAKENIVGTLGILYGGGEMSVYAAIAEAFTKTAGLSFLVFNLLCAPCFAAMGAIKREMNSAKWFWFAIGYECLFAYAVSLVVYQIGSAFAGAINILGLIIAIALVALMIYMLVRPYKESEKLTVNLKSTSAR